MVEVLGVIKLGVGLVQYIYNVFSDICKSDCSFSIDTRVSESYWGVFQKYGFQFFFGTSIFQLNVLLRY